MIEIGKYYQIQTQQGERTAKAMQLIEEGVYGVYSLSDYAIPEDNQGTIIPEGSPESTPEEAELWNQWYSNNS